MERDKMIYEIEMALFEMDFDTVTAIYNVISRIKAKTNESPQKHPIITLIKHLF